MDIIKRLARAVEQEDQRANPPIAQVVFYQTGVGSEENLYSRYVQGADDVVNGDRNFNSQRDLRHDWRVFRYFTPKCT